MGVESFIPEIWSAAVLAPYKQNLRITPTVTRQYEGEARSGNAVIINSFADLKVQDYKAKNRTFEADALTTTSQKLSIDQEKVVAYTVDNIDRVQVAGSLDSVTSAAGEALAEDVEAYLVKQLQAVGKKVKTVEPTDGASAFAAINALRGQLSAAKVPLEGRYLAVSPDMVGFLLGADSKLTAVNTAGSDGELRNGVLGRVLGFTVIEHTALTGKQAIAYHGRAAALVEQIEESRAIPTPNAHSTTVSHLLVYGAAVVRKDGVAQLDSSWLPAGGASA